jgi:nitrogen regulatory protein P-II 1
MVNPLILLLMEWIEEGELRMKKIEAYIRPEKLEDIKGALDELNLNGLSICQVMGFGRQKGWKEFVRGSEVDYNFVPKVKLEIVVADEEVELIVSKIIEIAGTGNVGDGKIFISDIADAIRIRTQERGLDAIK